MTLGGMGSSNFSFGQATKEGNVLEEEWDQGWQFLLFLLTEQGRLQTAEAAPSNRLT